VIVLWVALMAAGAQWLASARPGRLELAGAVLATGEAEPQPQPKATVS
jgi:hypothetical protein